MKLVRVNIGEPITKIRLHFLNTDHTDHTDFHG